jgi:hypothetical protein
MLWSGVVVSLAAHQLGRDRLLAKSTQGVPYRPWPGLAASAGLLKSAEIRARWCQLWVLSASWRPVRFSFCRDHLIRRHLHAHPLPAHSVAYLPKYFSGTQ